MISPGMFTTVKLWRCMCAASMASKLRDSFLSVFCKLGTVKQLDTDLLMSIAANDLPS